MDLHLPIERAVSYASGSQKARVFTEHWVLGQIYCPSCGDAVRAYGNNRPVADFFCAKCVEDFELKSKKGNIGKKVAAGAYQRMMERLHSSQNPNFFFMSYRPEWIVGDFFVVPKHFVVPGLIEKRKALAFNARRAGWVGSNILLSEIPRAGRIFYVEQGVVAPKADVLAKWGKTVFLKKVKKVEAKGWILDIMNCIDALERKEFSLADLYAFEEDLRKLHPENRHIKDKVRQQLQLLRDEDYLVFTGKGTYRLRG